MKCPKCNMPMVVKYRFIVVWMGGIPRQQSKPYYFCRKCGHMECE